MGNFGAGPFGAGVFGGIYGVTVPYYPVLPPARESPFEITIYDRLMRRVGWVGDPLKLDVTPRHNAVGSATLVLPVTHRRLADLDASGARVRITYHGERIISGPVRLVGGAGPTRSGTVTFTVEDDSRILWNVLGWPNPLGSITAQGEFDKYDKRVGPAETVLKGMVQDNAATRIGIPLVVAPDHGRGATLTIYSRMHVLADRLLPAIDGANIGFTIDQQVVGGVPKFVLDCYTPKVYRRALSEESGTILNWELNKSAPTVTRTVVGGSSEGTAREYRPVVDSAREAEWGDVIEVFTDARSTTISSEMDAAGAATLSDGAPTSGFKVDLAETSTFRYGGVNGVHVGDKVTVQVGPTFAVTDLLREVTISWDVASGLKVTPSIGGFSESRIKTLVAGVATALKGMRDYRASR